MRLSIALLLAVVYLSGCNFGGVTNSELLVVVRNADDLPMQGANVNVSLVGNTVSSGITDSQGEFSVSLARGAYIVSVSKDSFESQDRSVTLTPSETTSVRFILQKGMASGIILEQQQDCPGGDCGFYEDLLDNAFANAPFVDDYFFRFLDGDDRRIAEAEAEALNEKARELFGRESHSGFGAEELFNAWKSLVIKRISLYERFGVLPVFSGGLSAEEFIAEHEKLWEEQLCDDFGECISGNLGVRNVQNHLVVFLQGESGGNELEGKDAGEPLPGHCRRTGEHISECFEASPMEILGIAFSRSVRREMFASQPGVHAGAGRKWVKVQSEIASLGSKVVTEEDESGAKHPALFIMPVAMIRTDYDACIIEGEIASGVREVKWGSMGKIVPSGGAPLTYAITFTDLGGEKPVEFSEPVSRSARWGLFSNACTNEFEQTYGRIVPEKEYEFVERTQLDAGVVGRLWLWNKGFDIDDRTTIERISGREVYVDRLSRDAGLDRGFFGVAIRVRTD